MLQILVIAWLCFGAAFLIGFFGSWITQKLFKSSWDIFIWVLSIGCAGTLVGFVIWVMVKIILTIIKVL